MNCFCKVFVIILALSIVNCGGNGGNSSSDDYENAIDNNKNPIVVKTTKFSNLSECPNGGIRVDSGIDENSNGSLDEFEIDRTQYVCHGTDGINTLVNIETEVAGSNCDNGGIRIESGLDLNNNSNLDDSEIDDYKYICNGVNGVDGTDGTDGIGGYSDSNYYIVSYYANGGPTSFECNGYSSSKTINDYYTYGSDRTGVPMKTCITESCNTYVDNGYMFDTIMYGDEGCPCTNSNTLRCDSGYVGIDGHCVPSSSLSSLEECETYGFLWWNNSCHENCPEGQVLTSRGCEEPISDCTQYQYVSDNQCIEMTFTTIEGNICGQYDQPVIISGKDHFITCDSVFKKKVIIEPNARLLVDDNWKLTFNELYADGTTGEIQILTSTNNPSGKWDSIKIGNYTYSSDLCPKFNPLVGYETGNYLKNVIIDGFSNTSGTASAFRSCFLDGITVNGKSLYAYNSYITNSLINLSNNFYISTEYNNNYTNYLLYSQINVPSCSFYNTFVAWCSFDEYQTLNDTITINDYSAIFYSHINGSINVKSHSKLFGNAAQNINATSCTNCLISDNGSSISEKPSVHILNNNTDAKLSENVLISTLIFDQYGFINDSLALWELNYDVDGTTYIYSDLEGSEFYLAPSAKESYLLELISLDGVYLFNNEIRNILGGTNLVLNVY